MPTPEARAERERQARDAAIDEVRHRVHRSWPLVTAVFVIAGLFVAYTLTALQARSNADRRQTEQIREVVERGLSLISQVEAEQKALEAETKSRTSQSCQNQVIARNELRQAFSNLYDAADAANVQAGAPPSQVIAAARALLDRQFPQLTCSDGGSVVVIAEPVPASPPGSG